MMKNSNFDNSIKILVNLLNLVNIKSLFQIFV